MKQRFFFALLLTTLLLTGCHRDMAFTTRSLNGTQCYLINDDDYPFGEKLSYNLVWPTDGQLTPEAEQELLSLCFGDKHPGATVDESAKWWLETSIFSDDYRLQRTKVDSIDESGEFSYCHLETFFTQDSNLVTFYVKTESYGAGAAHGLYSAESRTIDLSSGNIIHLADLTDTALLGSAIAHAVQDLDVNREVYDCLFDEWRDAERMPVPHDFFIDSTRSTIVVSYPLYEITPYCCGIPSVVLPIYWLSKHVPLSPYAKQLFGSGCSVD